jgi:hypothetical protein
VAGAAAVTGWDLATWLAVLLLGPGSVVVFVAFLRDLRRLLGAPEGRPGAQQPPSSRGEGRRPA